MIKAKLTRVDKTLLQKLQKFVLYDTQKYELKFKKKTKKHALHCVRLLTEKIRQDVGISTEMLT